MDVSVIDVNFITPDPKDLDRAEGLQFQGKTFYGSGAPFTGQAEKMANHEFSSFDVERTVKKMVMDDKYFGSESLKKEVTHEVARQIVDKMELSIKK